MARKVIIDADPGIADAIAISLALLDPDLDVLGVTATAGTVSGRDATRNASAVVEAVDPRKRPRLGRCMEDEQRCQPVACSQSPLLNGTSGLGDTDVDVAELHHQHESSRLILELVRDNPHEITLLTLGPLTNILFAYERAPDVFAQLQEVMFLGGSVTGMGDITATAEFNLFGNPEAAEMLVRHAISKTMIPLEVSTRPVLSFDHFRRLEWTQRPLSQFLQRLFAYSLRQHHHVLGQEGITIPAMVGLCALTRPHLFESMPMSVDIELMGSLTRGMSVFDRREPPEVQPNVEVVHGVDTTGVLEYLAECISRAGLK